MRTRIILLVCVFAVCLMAGSIHAGTICIDEIGNCNDVKLTYTDQEGSIIEGYGYEYGCGAVDRFLSGSIHIVGNTAHIGLSGMFGPTPFLALRYYTINLSSMTGTGAWSYNNGTVWSGTTTITGASCAPTAEGDVQDNGPDSSVR